MKCMAMAQVPWWTDFVPNLASRRKILHLNVYTGTSSRSGFFLGNTVIIWSWDIWRFFYIASRNSETTFTLGYQYHSHVVVVRWGDEKQPRMGFCSFFPTVFPLWLNQGPLHLWSNLHERFRLISKNRLNPKSEWIKCVEVQIAPRLPEPAEFGETNN